MTTSTQTLDKPLEDTTTGDDTPKMFHYVRKNKIAESAVMGNFVVALCGETFPVTKSPKPDSPVCPDCKKIYESDEEGLTLTGSARRRSRRPARPLRSGS